MEPVGRTAAVSLGFDDWISDTSIDKKQFVEKTRSALEARGYVHLTGQFSLSDYENIANKLGTVFLTTDIKVIEGSRPNDVASSVAFRFHTDSRCARFISWYCVTPGNKTEPTILLDLGDLTDRLPESVCHPLSKIQVAGTEPDRAGPIMWMSETGTRLNFIPWRVAAPANSNEEEALVKLQELIVAKATHFHEAIAILLSVGEILFIDNHRVLHGRPELDKQTARHLKRFWISEDPEEKNRWSQSQASY